MPNIKEALPIKSFEYGMVQLTDHFCRHAYEKEKAYLESIDAQRLLSGFRETAGFREKEKCYGGWESTEIKGHTLGHYLSALSQMYAYEPTEKIEKTIDKICNELKVCQRQDGYLFASSEELFDKVEQHQPVWVPWYTMHKILSGLILAYQLGKNQTAYEVADHLGSWIFQRCHKWNEETQRQVLSVEYGGMNDCLYELYKITRRDEHLQAAHLFDEMPLLDKLYSYEDILNGLHANTTIPKIIGALNRYEVTGEEYFLKAAVNFWEIVVKHHTYITGGNSEWEHFGMPDILDGERTACNCETCNTYNMLKLTQKLFEATGERKYASFYERTWINAILSSQNPETGMTTYFQPMETGFFKVYGTPYDRFWCCTGTGMENFTKLQDGIFYHDEEAVYINHYISARLQWKERLELEMTTDFPNLEETELTVKPAASRSVKLYLCIPEWLDGKMQIKSGEQVIPYEEEAGYAVLELKEEAHLTLRCPVKISYESLPDQPSAVAFRYGPFVLSAPLGAGKMHTAVTGVDVLVATKENYIKDYLIIENESVQDWLAHLDTSLIKDKGKMKFHLRGTDEDENICFVPHYSQYKERYGIYWYLYEKGSKQIEVVKKEQEEKWRRIKASIDCIQVGNDQYELAHKIRGEQTETIHYKEHRGRVIRSGGWVRYEIKCQKDGCILNMFFCSEDKGHALEIDVNGEPFIREIIDGRESLFYTKSYEITEDKLKGKVQAELLIKVDQGGQYCRIFDEIFITKKDK